MSSIKQYNTRILECIKRMKRYRQENLDSRNSETKGLSENMKRVETSKEQREHNKRLVETAKGTGITTNLDYGIFQNHGYQGLYGGLGSKETHNIKGLSEREHTLDHMGSIELVVNLFRVIQIEEKLREENTICKDKTNGDHREVGTKIRITIGS